MVYTDVMIFLSKMQLITNHGSVCNFLKLNSQKNSTITAATVQYICRRIRSLTEPERLRAESVERQLHYLSHKQCLNVMEVLQLTTSVVRI